MPITGFPAPPGGVSNNNASGRGWGPGWPACQTDKLLTITLANGVRLTVRREISTLVRLLLNEALRRGYVIRRADSGGFNCRAITGTLIPSNHSWGLAVDLNWQLNPMGTHQTNMPTWLVSLMWEFGFYWGGWYASPDPMHYEYVGTPAQAAVHTSRARGRYEALPKPPPTAPPKPPAVVRLPTIYRYI